MLSDAREDRASLSRDVVDAVAKVYRAKADYNSANQKRAQNIDALAVWRETTRRHLSNHGFVESEEESFAETMPRALGISTHELRNCIAENRVGAALLERFRGLENTTDMRLIRPRGILLLGHVRPLEAAMGLQQAQRTCCSISRPRSRLPRQHFPEESQASLSVVFESSVTLNRQAALIPDFLD
jgi:hypothetical protein